MKRLEDLAINPNGFAFEPTFGEAFLLNETGLETVRALRNGIEPAAQALAEKYGRPVHEMLSDVFDFVAKLRLLGFEVE